jgi:DNA uptake protein ComE-like DNA-binding protein
VQNNVRAVALSVALLCAGSLVLPQSATPHAAQKPVSPALSPVDVNRATVDELMKVPGMTRVWAARIVRFRPYRSKLDLTEQGVLPGDVYNKIKDYVIAHHM